MTSAEHLQRAQGGGYPPGGYGGGPPPGGSGPPGGPGGYGPPGPGGYGPPGAGAPGGYGPPGAPGGYGPPAPPYGAPYPPQGGAPWGAPGGGPASSEFKKNAQLWLVIAAVSSVLCTCLFGVIGAVFCYMAMQANDQGNAVDAANKLKWGKIITVVGLVFGVVLTIFSIIYAAQFTQSITSMMTGS